MEVLLDFRWDRSLLEYKSLIENKENKRWKEKAAQVDTMHSLMRYKEKKNHQQRRACLKVFLLQYSVFKLMRYIFRDVPNRANKDSLILPFCFCYFFFFNFWGISYWWIHFGRLRAGDPIECGFFLKLKSLNLHSVSCQLYLNKPEEKQTKIK